jgi:uncharacterized protein (DUF4415 family)
MRPDDDLPEITDEMLNRADLYHGNKLIEAGEGGPNPRVAEAIRRTAGRPRLENPKQAIKLRLDAEVVEHFRATGPGWQTRINEALRRLTRKDGLQPVIVLANEKGKERRLTREDLLDMKSIREVMPVLIKAVEAFRKKGPGYNARVEEALRKAGFSAKDERAAQRHVAKKTPAKHPSPSAPRH